MATGKDLIDAVRSSLENEGELGQIKADMKMKIINLLQGSHVPNKSKLPAPSCRITITNEIIREYLDWMGYKYTSSVFVSECELSKQPLDRALISENLGTLETEKTKELPLLFCLIETLKELKSA